MKIALSLTASVALASAFVAPAVARDAGKKLPISLSGFAFNNKANLKVTAKVGDSAVFTWKDGVHNVKTSKAPKGAKPVNSGAPAEGAKPLTYTFKKKGTYVMYCEPHQALGMVVTVTVK